MRLQARSDLAVCGRASRIPGQHHDVNRRQGGSALAETLSHQAAKPVAANSQSNFLLGNREAEARSVQVVRMEQDREKSIHGSLTILKHVIKVCCAEQALLPREALPVFVG